MPRIAGPHHVKVKSEIDVVTLRQQVRQIARILGLGLTQQARVTAAISTVARSLVEGDHTGVFTIQASHRQVRPSLEISCVMPCDIGNGITHIEEMLHFSEARSLVDEADLTMKNQDEACLSLRIWISS